jgi:predicted dehydrogenase
MNEAVNRRSFLKRSAVLAAGTAALADFPSLQAAGAHDKLRVGVIGCGGRGMAHIAGFLGVPEVEIAGVCDVDSRALAKGIEAAAKKQAQKPKGFADLRKMLEDPNLDAVSIAMPDHWHAPATILACAAGKHVYVEKPGSHNAREGELMVAAARQHQRVVQMGNQRRSWPWVIESIAALKAGEIGKLFFARCWYTNRRASIGRGKVVPVPEWLDYSLWQGPAPERPYKDNLIHYNWHWFWNWGTAEIGNNGVHSLDLARWGMDLDLPKRVTCGGNRYFYQDDWETPDTCVATFDFGHKGVVWEGQSCAPRGFDGSSFGVAFHGEKGVLAILGNKTIVSDPNGKALREIEGRQRDLFQFDSVHFQNFADAVREGKPLKAEIEEGQKSTLLCHLVNMAWRSGQTVDFDPQTRRVINEKVAAPFWTREYRPGWEPKV